MAVLIITVVFLAIDFLRNREGILSIVFLLIPFISYPLTIYDQNMMNRVFRGPFVKLVNSFNNAAGTKIQSAMLLHIRKDFAPYVDYGYRNGVRIGFHTNALIMGDHLIKYLKENNEIGIRNTSRWLLKNYEKKKNYIIWKADYERPDFNLKKGWVSGYYQSRALKALCMLYEKNKNKKILDVIKKGLDAFYINIENGGFKVNGKYGYWYEEYPQKGIKPPFVLNGFVESLIDLNYIYEKIGIKKAKELFNSGLKELKEKLKEFDTGSWTYYDLLKHPARFDYHQIHIREMMDMHKITGDKLFLKTAKRWKEYKKVDLRFWILNVLLLDVIVSIIYFLL